MVVPTAFSIIVVAFFLAYVAAVKLFFTFSLLVTARELYFRYHHYLISFLLHVLIYSNLRPGRNFEFDL